MSVARQAICVALAAGTAATVAFAWHRPHVNWAIWSAITVVQVGAHESMAKSGRRILGAVLGCAAGYALLMALHTTPWLLGAVAIVLACLMIAPQTYVVAVAIRSALAILAAIQFGGDGITTALARIENIGIGVAIAMAFVMILMAGAGGRPRDDSVAARG
jgi:uncharacterized membrane protein YccC